MKHIDTFYVLREIGTDKYMPQLDGRGYTHTEFRAYCIPRLFTTARAAQTALTWWLRGPVTVDLTHFEGERDEVWRDPKPHEARTNKIEVVPVDLTAAH